MLVRNLAGRLFRLLELQALNHGNFMFVRDYFFNALLFLLLKFKFLQHWNIVFVRGEGRRFWLFSAFLSILQFVLNVLSRTTSCFENIIIMYLLRV